MKNKAKQNLVFWKKITLLTLLFLCITNVNAQCWKSVSVGPFHTIAIKNDGTLWSWGGSGSASQVYGALGQGPSIMSVCIPKQVGTDSDWETVSVANNYSLALKTNGTLWACGSNNGYGNTGFSSLSDVHVLTQVGLSTNWKSISAGNFLAMGIKTDGTLWGWAGGVGNTANGITQNTPTQMGLANNWKEVSCGYDHVLALKTDNTLWTSGRNTFGELGNGNNTNVNVLTQIGTTANWKTISAGEKFSLAIKNDGTLWAWGRNNYNQLGDGTVLNKNIPTRIGIATDWSKVTATSFDHAFAIKTNGTLWGWGRNNYYQLGDGTTTNKITPTQIGTATNWKSISGNYITMALKTDNTLWGIGSNLRFQVGIPNSSAGSTTLFITNFTQISCPDPIIASTDYGTSIYGTAGVAVNNVLLNDTYFGNQATSSNIKLNFVNSTNSGITLNTTTGAVNVAATVPTGTYTLIYSICDINTNYCLNCGTAGTVIISVISSTVYAINDSGTAINGIASTPITNILSNDAYNNIPATLSNVTLSLLSSTNSGITLNTSTGEVNVTSTVPVGSYTLTYQICDINNTSNCSTGTVTINITSPIIDAINDDFSSMPINYIIGGFTNSVLLNDTLNGNIVNSNELTTTIVNNGGLTGTTIDSFGVLNIPPGLPIGSYILTYSICQNSNPVNCDLTSVLIIISAPIINTPNISFGNRANNFVKLIGLQSNSKAIISGAFTQYNNINSYNIARLNTDLTLDSTFSNAGPSTGATWDLKVLDNDKIILVGNFEGFNNGSNGKGIAKLNSDGSVDTSFNIGGTGIPILSNQVISAVTTQLDGKILLGGAFMDSYNGTTVRNMIRLNTDGSIDNSFLYPYPVYKASIFKIIVQPDGKILVGGNRNLGSTTNPKQQNIFRLNTDGSLDTTFTLGDTGTNVFQTNCASCLNPIENILILSDGKIIVIGTFDSYNGVASKNIVKLNSNGSIDTTFNTGSSTNRGINDIVLEPDGKLLITGEFTSFNGNNVNKIIRLNVDGSFDSTFNSGIGTSDNTGTGNAYNYIKTLERQPDGKIILGGKFTSYNNISAQNITRIVPSIPGSQARGTELYIVEAEIEKNRISEEIKIYPNPSNGNFNIDFGDSNGNCSFEIFSLLGQKVFEQKNVTDSTVSISNLNSGIYLIKVSKDGKSITQKIIVN